MKSIKLLVLSVVAALSSLTASADNYLRVVPATVNTDNDELQLDLELVNDDSKACAFQCDIVLPTGMKVVLDEEGLPDITAVAARINKHSYEAAYQSDGSLRVLFYNTANRLVKGNSGAIIQIPVTVDDTLKGDYEITVKNQEINTYDATAEAGSRVGVIRPDDVTTSITVTAIESVKADADNAPSTIYTVDGKKVKDATKGGVYIKDGKKVLVK